MSADLPPAGWYPNPDGSGGLRWWSGVGWTEYTRQSGPVTQPAPQENLTQQLDVAQPTTVVPEAEQVTTALPDAEQSTAVVSETPQQWTPEQPQNPWAQTTQPAQNQWGQPAAAGPWGGYAAYQPPPQQPLTNSGMRHLGGMFSDIGRIVRRGWLPIIGISLAIWVAVSAVYAAALATTVDLDALQRGFDLLGGTSAETGLDTNDAELSAAFRDAFSALSPSGWALLIAALTVLLLLATAIQTAAVSRVGIDAAAGLPVSWGAAWKAGFTAGFRLFGYYLLLGLVVGIVWSVAALIVVGLWALAPALSVAVGILGFLALLAISFWFTGRLVPVMVQVVQGRRAISWSWRHTKGKFWGVLGRYLLWSLAASIIVNIVVSVISIPLSLVFLGTASSGSSTAQLGTSMVLSLITLPISMALSAVTFIGIVPIWRDLTEDPQYRSIDENGMPITVP